MPTTSKRLEEIFGGYCYCSDIDWYSIERPTEPVNLRSLLRACAVLECAPEDIYFNADAETSGGCSSCSSAYAVLEIEVRRESK